MSKWSHPLYKIWVAMQHRCHNSKYKDFQRYGGRGIAVCQRWRNSFWDFVTDVGERPAGMTLERRNNNGNYEPENCRWATRLEQMANTRRNHLVSFNGETLHIAEWSRKTGIGFDTIQTRIKRGWTPEKALTTHVAPRKQKTTVRDMRT